MAASMKARRQLALHEYSILVDTYPSATCELDFDSAFQLLISTILSAQTTDKGVNVVTKELYRRYPGPQELAEANPEDVEEIIHSIGFYRVKAASIIETSHRIEEDFGGEVPRTLEELITLPGVGRKTANVVLAEAFHVPTITTDTHVLRVARRLGWTGNHDPVKVEKDLCALFPSDTWIQLCHVVIWHGRRRCHSQRPACGACPLGELCPSFGEGPTDPKTASKLVTS